MQIASLFLKRAKRFFVSIPLARFPFLLSQVFAFAVKPLKNHTFLPIQGANFGSLFGSLLVPIWGHFLGRFWGSFWVTFWATFWITFEASLECPEVPFKAHRKGASLPAQLPGCPEVPSGVHIRPPAPFAYGSSSMHRHSFESARSSSNKPKPATGSFASLSGVESIEFL